MQRIKTHQKNNLSVTIMIGGIIDAVLLIFSSLYFLLYPFPSTEEISYFTSSNPIIDQGGYEYEAFINEGEIYLPLTYLQKYIDEGLIFDQATNSIILTTKDKVIQLPSDSLTFFINQEPVNLEIPVVTRKDGDIYLSYQTIKSYYTFEANLLPDTGAIHILRDGDSVILGEVLTSKSEHTLRLRSEPDQS